MQNTTVVSPDALVLNTAVGGSDKVRAGSLATQLDVDINIVEKNIASVLQHTDGKVDVLIHKLSKKPTLPIRLLLPSLANFLAMHASNEVLNESKVEKHITNWKQYFLACQQLLLNFPDFFAAEDVTGKTQTALRQSFQLAIINDDALEPLYEDWASFVVNKEDATQTAAVIAKIGKDYAEKDVQIQDLQGENELVLLQLNQLQEELEDTYLTKAKERQTEKPVTDLEQVRSENELLLLQLTQVQEELEHYYIEHNKAIKATEAKVDTKLKNSLPRNHITLLQNTVNEHDESLVIRVHNLTIDGQIFPIYDLKVWAHRVRENGFTRSGSIELRVQVGGRAPLINWKPNTKDRFGKKLNINLDSTKNQKLKAEVVNMPDANKQFLKSLLSFTAENIANAKSALVKMERPIDHWQSLLVNMNSVLSNA